MQRGAVHGKLKLRYLDNDRRYCIPSSIYVVLMSVHLYEVIM